MQTLADVILAPGALTVRFQPVMQVGKNGFHLHALECLSSGPGGTNAERACVLFDYVRFKRLEPVVDRACVAAAMSAATVLPGTPTLFVNVHATTIGRDPDFPSFLAETAARHDIDLGRVTIELVEHTHYADGPSFCAALRKLRALGLTIALDDVGLGHSNYRRMLDAEPEYLKIDRYLVHGAYGDVHRLAVVDSIAKLATRLGSRVIAEGAEEPADLYALEESGIDLVQGYLLGRPMTADELVTRGWFDTAAPRVA